MSGARCVTIPEKRRAAPERESEKEAHAFDFACAAGSVCGDMGCTLRGRFLCGAPALWTHRKARHGGRHAWHRLLPFASVGGIAYGFITPDRLL
jgi:hypothetical protein